jgi:hypothetical protein
MREWSHCMGAVTLDLPTQPVPDDIAGAASAALRRQFDLDEDLLIADHVIVKSATLAGSSGPLDVRLPVLLQEFQLGHPGRPPIEIAKVLFLGNVETMRGYGRLVRDSANGAINALERA